MLNCPESPRLGTPGPAILPSLPWIAAHPTSSGIIGILFYGNRTIHSGGEFPRERLSTKILWLVRRALAGDQLEIRGTESSGKTRFEQLERPALRIDPKAEYDEFPSIVMIPVPGCWRLELSSGLAKGEVVFKVAE
jgi:hypothetical protein